MYLKLDPISQYFTVCRCGKLMLDLVYANNKKLTLLQDQNEKKTTNINKPIRKIKLNYNIIDLEVDILYDTDMEVNKNGDLVQNSEVILEEQHIPLILVPSFENLQEEHDISVIVIKSSENVQKEQDESMIPVSSSEIIQHEQGIPVIVINSRENVQKEQDVSMISAYSSEIVQHEQDIKLIEVNSGEFVQEVLNKSDNRTTTKQNRMKGIEYNGYSRQKVHDKFEIKQNVTRLARHQKPPCKLAICIRISIRFCSQFSENERKAMFSLFWNMSRDKKKYMC